MKVAVSATGNTPQASVHSQFGRCDYFLIFEDKNEEVKAIENSYAGVETGAGIGCAQDLVREGVEVVISGQVGPKAYEVLNEAGVEIYLAPPDITAQDAYEKLLSKKLRKMEILKF
jgi:predicted Fe-Mo cluster-binding NifX family protein